MWNKLKQMITNKRFFIQISITAGIAVIIATMTVSLFVINMSEEVYLDAYKDFNDKIMDQVSDEYYQLHVDVVNVLTLAQDSQSVEDYFTEDNLNSVEEGQIIYKMKEQVSDYVILHQKVSSNLMLVGFNGKKYTPGSSAGSDSAQEIISSDIIQDALSRSNQISYYYAEDGFTGNTKDTDLIIAVKVLRNYSSKKEYGVAIIMMNEKEFASYYESLIDSKINKVYCVDTNGKIVSTNNAEYEGTENNEISNLLVDYENEEQFEADINNSKYAVRVADFPFMEFKLMSMIDESALMAEINFLPPVLIFTFAISILLIGIVVILLRKYFTPLNVIVDHIPEIIEGDFDNQIEVDSSGEIMELADAFNYMLDGLNNYVDNVVKLESEKKLSEIHALQMQINPHFVYNTLTSIKFLMWQNKNEQAIQAMDAFIELLRNTLGSDEEYSSVQSEIDNLKNYVMIQNIRYNDKVSVSYHISEECKELEIVKMLMQPFVENAFFHAFPDQEHATINIFARIKKDYLVIEIIDNGKGIEKEKLQLLLESDHNMKKGLSGLGIKNVNNRIKLLYGDDYGVEVSSILHQGTIITIKLPVLQKKAQ